MTDRNQDQWRDANRHRALTQQQVAELPVGTEVDIVWSGGNGPGHYIVCEQLEILDRVETYVRVKGCEHWLDRGRVRDPVSFVGAERYRTHVVLTDPKADYDG